MPNPAHELADLLEAWMPQKGMAPTTTRATAGQVQPGTLPFWRYMEAACRLVREVEARIDQMQMAGRNVDHYRRVLTPCYQSIFMPSTNWRATTPVQAGDKVSTEQLDNLRALGDVIAGLDTDSHLPGDRVDRIRESLEAILREIADLPSTPARDHLQWQVEQAIFFAERSERFGGPVVAETAVRAVREAGDFADTDEVDDERRSRLHELRRDIIVNLFSSAVFQAGYVLTTGPAAEVVKALLGGS